MTIYDIKARTQTTSPHFFTRSTMNFFHQRLKDFRIKKQANGKYYICCPMRDHLWQIVGYTERLFNPETNELEDVTG